MIAWECGFCDKVLRSFAPLSVVNALGVLHVDRVHGHVSDGAHTSSVKVVNVWRDQCGLN